MPALLTKIALFSLPLIFWPNPLKFELPKVILFLALSFFLIIWFLKKGKFEKIENKTWFFWVGLLFLSTTLNNQIIQGLVGYGYRHQGVIFFLILGLWMIAFSFFKKSDQKKISWWISMTIIIESLIVIFQWAAIKLNFPILSYNQRPIGTFGEPNAVAGFLVLGLPILLNLFHQIFIPLILVIVAIILTGSKAGILALLAELVAFAFWKKKKFLLITSLILIILTGIFGVWQEKNESLFENRWLIWNLGIRAVLEKPILGYGAEGIISAYDQQYQKIDRSLMDLTIDRSHNLFLDVFLFSGLLGLVFFTYWFWAGVTRVRENWRLISLVGFSIYSFFQPLGVVHWFYLITLLSPYSGTQRKNLEETKQPV